MADLIVISNAAADAHGLPRSLLLACAIAESGLRADARRPMAAADDERYWPDVSGGAWQQTVRWDPEYIGDGGYPGPHEIERVLKLQYDPARSARIAAQNLRYRYRANEPDAVFKALCRYNWPVGNGEPASDEIAANYRRGIAEAERLLAEHKPEPVANPLNNIQGIIQPLRVTEDGVRLRSGPGTDSRILATLRAGTEAVPLTDHAWRQVRVGEQTGWVAASYLGASGFGDASERQSASNSLQFDANTPAYYQRLKWTCAVGSTIWMLRSVGIDVAPEAAHDAMVPAYVNEDVGLLDASGAGIVRVLRDRWGVSARNDGDAAFDEVLAMAGRQPVAVGGRNWGGPGLGHWSAVRGRYGDTLVLANPARSGTYGQTTLTRQDWARLGPWSSVAVDL